jgi:cytochrome c-type biogenesis protein CcmF
MLLWVLILTFFGFLVACFGSNLRTDFKARVLSVQSAIASCFFAFILFTSNPFERYSIAPLNGQDLNPLLQDPGLAFHPPFLYMGYVGLSMSFSFAIAALMEGRVDAIWARWVRPWALLAWTFLTIGIAMGSWWAYYELGWGGWWFWDPVENASFMPWLVSGALLHSAIVLEKREILKNWTILLAILAFSFSLIGTFIVRSGIITSVHAFATDPTRGVFILIIIFLATGGGLTLFAFRSKKITSKNTFSLVSRESALILNNLLLVVSAFVVFIGTLWPLFADLIFGKKLSVGAPFFDIAFTPFFIAIAIVLPVGASLAWKRGNLGRTMIALWPALILGISLGSIVWVMQTGGRMMAPVGVSLATWLICGSMGDVWSRIRGNTLRIKIKRLLGLHRSDFGKFMAHSGLGITIFGIAAITAWEIEDIRIIKTGESFDVGSYNFFFKGVTNSSEKNYLVTRGEFIVKNNDKIIGTMLPEKRFYPIARMWTTEASIDQGITRDLYLVIGEEQDDGGWSVRTYLKPFANWIWFGALFMAAGGILSISDRRLRFSVGTTRASKVSFNE